MGWFGGQIVIIRCIHECLLDMAFICTGAVSHKLLVHMFINCVSGD